jgi:glycosyltransferase involved in cell wall biosynthesis
VAHTQCPLRILAFEPFDAGSHRAVREAISRHSRHEWTWITRPGRNWKWRMRLAAVELIDEALKQGLFDPSNGRVSPWSTTSSEAIDAIVLTSLMSAADLRALLPVQVRRVPVVLYMHENQAAYPDRAGDPETRFAASTSGDERDVHFALTNLTSILAADRVIWNSEWNKRSFIVGIDRILRACSDLKIAQVQDRIEDKSVVVWPPVNVPPMERPRVLHKQTGPVKVVWPHRWEHDKGPDELLAVAEKWSDAFDLRWTILGERYGETPPELIEFERRFQSRIDHIGFLPDRAAYLDKLSSCDWVLSTSRHEFFGIAVVEAMLAGCLPWLPERLSYPELLPMPARGLSPSCPPRDPDAVRAVLREHLRPALAQNSVSRLDHVIAKACSMQ